METSRVRTWLRHAAAFARNVPDHAAAFVRNIPDHAAAFQRIEVRPWLERSAAATRGGRRRLRRATAAAGEHMSPRMIRVTAFVRKDIVEIIRQPQLLLGVVLGPFLLLLVFGASLGDLAPELRTVVVAQRGSALFDLFQQFRFNPTGRFEISEVTPDREGALQRLSEGEIDIVLALPSEPQQTIRRGEPAEAILYHNFIDPLEARAIGTATQLSIGELNEQFVAALIRDAQVTAVEGRERLVQLRGAVRLLRLSLQSGETERAEATLPIVRRNLSAVREVLGPATVAAASADGDDPASAPLGQLDEVLGTLETITAVADPGRTDPSQLLQVESDLEQAITTLDGFTGLSPEVAISPLSSRVERVRGGDIGLPDFYAPAVLILLGQHLVITTVALATVQEQLYGTTELFAVAPLTAAERLLGRYVGALLLSLPTMLAMLAALMLGLGTPMLGSWWLLLFTIVCMLLASTGLGFLIAELSTSTTQAVQLSMAVLLGSVFFSGFVLSTQFFVGAGKVVGLFLPATYAIEALRDIMLRGVVLTDVPYVVLPLVALGLFAVNWLLLRRVRD
ncbi:MAG TPA: ABC transporter permease [Euzebyales bacterium]|nr:ABC transporter permease [Euzebyales bacterium]